MQSFIFSLLLGERAQIIVIIFTQNLAKKKKKTSAGIKRSYRAPLHYCASLRSQPAHLHHLVAPLGLKALRVHSETPTRSTVPSLSATASIPPCAPWLHSRLRCCMETLDGELPLIHYFGKTAVTLFSVDFVQMKPVFISIR